MDEPYRDFLRKRIPELQAQGKTDSPKGLTVAQRITRARRNLADSEYPGRKAREQADREWAERKAA